MTDLESHILQQHEAQIEMIRKKYHELNNDVIKIGYEVDAISEKVKHINSTLDNINKVVNNLERTQADREAQLALVKKSIPWMKALAFGAFSLVFYNHDQIVNIAKQWWTK